MCDVGFMNERDDEIAESNIERQVREVNKVEEKVRIKSLKTGNLLCNCLIS